MSVWGKQPITVARAKCPFINITETADKEIHLSREDGAPETGDFCDRGKSYAPFLLFQKKQNKTKKPPNIPPALEDVILFKNKDMLLDPSPTHIYFLLMFVYPAVVTSHW